MRRNRLKAVRIPDGTIQSAAGWPINAPGVYRRIIGVVANVTAASLGPNEPLECRMALRDGNADIPLVSTITPRAGAAPSDGVVGFTFGGVAAGDLDSGGRITGPLPDVWWGPDITVNLHLSQFTGGATVFSGCVVLLEECDAADA